MSAISRSGGSALSPATVADDAALAVAPGQMQRRVVTVIVSLVFAYLIFAAINNPRFQWDVVARYFTAEAILRGLSLSIALTVVMLIFSVVLGTLLALARASAYAPLQWFSFTYSWIFRAIPALVQLIFWFNLAYLVPVFSFGIPFGPTFFEISTNQLITPFIAAVLGLGLCEAAYMSEVIRAGLNSVDKGQSEAARAIGLSRTKAFFRIVLPQSMRFIVPPMGSQAILLLKGTSLVSVIALSDLLHSAQTIYNRTLEVVPLLMVATLWYLIIVSVMSVLQLMLERHFGRGHAQTRKVNLAERVAA